MRFVPAFAALVLGMALGFSAGLASHDRLAEVYAEVVQPPVVKDPFIPCPAPLPQIKPAVAAE